MVIFQKGTSRHLHQKHLSRPKKLGQTQNSVTVYYREGTTLDELDVLFAKDSVITDINRKHRFIRLQTSFSEAELLLLFPRIEHVENEYRTKPEMQTTTLDN